MGSNAFNGMKCSGQEKKCSGIIVCEPESAVSFNLHVVTLIKVTT